MRKFMCLSLVSFSLAVMPATIAPAAAAQASADDKQKVVCKHQRRTETRFPKKTCRTKGEWDAISENAKRQVAEDMNGPKINPLLGRGG